MQCVKFQLQKERAIDISRSSQSSLRKRKPPFRFPMVLEIVGGVPRRAYVTFLSGDGEYWKGVVGLAKRLRKVGAAHPLVVAVLPNVPENHRRVLESQGCIVRDIQPVYPRENQVQFSMAYYVINYSKLRIWEFVGYERMVYLDADIHVYENIDHLFDLPPGHFYAVMDCFCERTWSHTPRYMIDYSRQCPAKVTWPVTELGTPPGVYFNAGIFIFEPSISTCESLLATLKVTPPTPFAEQDFLNMFFRDVYKPIPLEYNMVLAMLWRHREKVDVEKVKVVHCCMAGSKLPKYTGKEENMDREDIKLLVKRWWDVSNDELLGHKSGAVAFASMEAAAAAGGLTRPFIQAFTKAGAVKYGTAPSAA